VNILYSPAGTPMSPLLRRCLSGLFLIALFWCGEAAIAQTVRFETVEERSDGRTISIEISWNEALSRFGREGVPYLDRTLLTSIGYGWPHAYENVPLPSLVLPRASVLSVDFDELTVSGADDEIAAEVNLPVVEVSDLGVYRRQPTATLVANLVTYDESRRVIRRYRRILVSIAHAPRSERSLLSPPAALAASAGRSALADGAIFKIPIRDEGVYRIDREVISRLGLNPAAIEPNNVRVFTNGGRPLPALNADPRPEDLIETPTFVRGGGDGAFQQGDVVLFYAAAPSGWTWDASRGEWAHYVNPFSNDNFVFLKIDTAAGLRVGNSSYPDLSGLTPVASVTGRFSRDIERLMWSHEGGSGLNWVSDRIGSTGRIDILTNQILPGLEAGQLQYRARVAIKSNPVASAFIRSGETVLQEFRGARITGSTEAPTASAVERSFTQTIASPAPLNLNMRLQEQTGDPSAAFDWIRILYPQALRAEGGILRFATPAGQSGPMEFRLGGFTQEPQVWDVTSPGSVRRLGTRSVNGNYHVQMEVASGNQPREVIAFVESATRTITADATTRIENQNLRGIDTYPHFVIVTPLEFKVFADELADRRRAEGLNVLVTQVEHIFNEFGGGLGDFRAIRDYFRFLYLRAPDETRMLRYALLFGDGHYNFRNLGSPLPGLVNWIPPYQTDETFDPIFSYTSDDYFGLLDDHEGMWVFTANDRPGPVVERLDIGVGRLPVQTPAEARSMLDKISHYESAATFGAWRTRYTFVADNGFTGQAGNFTDWDLHVQNADVVAEMVRANYQKMNIRKIYATNYERVFRNGWRIPDANRDIMSALNEGTLLFNYSGHGSPNLLTQERIFTREDAMSLTNWDALSIFVTATCSFGRWDMDGEQSGAELLLLNPRGGAVALLTTVRLVYTSSGTTTLNVGMNLQVNRDLFSPDEQGLPRRLGDALRATKNTTVGLQGNNRKFNLLGDPTMRIGLPSRPVSVTHVGGQSLGEGAPVPVRALDRLTITGEVRNVQGGVDTSFDGVVDLTIFDAVRQVMLPYQRNMPTPYFLVREDLIWRGSVTAVSGRFDATFVVPKDISYSNLPGRIAVYARGSTGHGAGATENLVVGGTSPNPPDDSEGPRIRLFLNDTTFVSGGLTPSRPDLIVRLWDESGINTVGAGVGHEILVVINGDEQNATDVSGSFQSDPDSYQSGSIRWRMPEQRPGPNRLRVRAWDVLNNSSTAEMDFEVAATEDLRLNRVYNYPNPTTGPTRFIFEHNQLPGTPARVQIRVFTLNGRPIKTIMPEEALPSGVLPAGPVQISWNGLDDDFDRLSTGVYLYRVRVEVDTADGGRQVAEIIERLAIIR
jgi:hypothetical protein